MGMIPTAIFMATNFYLLYQVYYWFKLTQELRDEIEEKNKRIWDLEDKLRELQHELRKNEGIRNRSRKKL